MTTFAGRAVCTLLSLSLVSADHDIIDLLAVRTTSSTPDQQPAFNPTLATHSRFTVAWMAPPGLQRPCVESWLGVHNPCWL